MIMTIGQMIGKQLARERETLGFTQEGMSKRLELSQSRISRHEKDASALSVDTLGKWVRALNTDYGTFSARAMSDYKMGFLE